ncbi:unnamed protein product [Cuscuta campestris]|uniref:Retrotransposon gag domain-containing protein n=1 Tax=Cuscuta campestris TaxID=132261 RepID=A0A484MTV8_9ASTE|nr:unnamed protein product [Cuscuta campestris]
MEGGSETTNVTKGGEKKTKTQRSRSRETMDGFETRLARVELAIADGEEKFEEMGQGMDEFPVEVSSIQVELEKVSRKLESAEEELVLCKKALAQGSPSTSEVRTPPSELDIPRPKSYKGSRNAKELDNFIWSMEQYFRALAISEEKRKVDMASLFLEDTAMVWWRRRQGDMEKGTCTIDTWAEFKSELKKQFYPNNVEEEAWGKLRRLQHKGSIREYVKEFTEVLLEIPDYPDKEAFFAFMDGLQQWARLELQRRGAQDLTTAISIAESLIEFKKPEKPKPKDKGGKGKSGGDHHRDKETTKKTRGSKEYKAGERPPLKCFFCEGPHRARECPKKAKLSALIEEREEQEREEERVGSLQLLNAIKAKVEMSKSNKKGRLFVEAKIGRHTVKALVDTGASNNFLREEEARKLGIDFKGERGWLKAVNSKPMATFGVAQDVKVSLGDWHGPIDFSVVTMDDYPIVLGMEFMDKVKAIPIPFANTMCILDEGNTRLVPLKREARLREKQISTMQLSKGIKKKQPTYLVALKEEEVPPPTEDLPRSVDLVLEEFKDVMPPELPKNLPPKREVDHKIELVPGATPPAAVPYRMAPLELEELRRQLKELVDMGYGYSAIAAPLTDLLKKNRVWDWEDKCQAAFEELKEAVIKEPVLTLLDHTKPYEVQTDAFDYALGGVLMQKGHPVAYESRKLNDVERRYTVQEKEMTAVVHCLRTWRHYLLGTKFVVKTSITHERRGCWQERDRRPHA